MPIQLCFALIFILIPRLTDAKTEVWTVASLEWPPYVCEKCPDEGAAVKALRSALKSINVELEVLYLPWSRTLKEARSPHVIGFFPAWPEESRVAYTASPVLFRSPLGFIEPVGKPLQWQNLEDLTGKRIGVVQDYGNTVEFNLAVRNRKIKTEIVTSDDINIKKVAANRIDGALIDLVNAKWFLKTDLKDLENKVSFSPRVLSNKDLLIYFNAHNKNKIPRLKEALRKINTQKIVDDYLREHLK